jgi:purine-binding chemotaxis protein CheW
VKEEARTRSDQILDLAAQRRLEKQVVDVEVDKVLVIVFQMKTHHPAGQFPLASDDGFYGLFALSVESIVPIDSLTYVPGTPPWILGVVNVRGEIESVLDLRVVLGLSRAEIAPASRLLIARDGDLRSGLLVDQVVDIVEIPQTSITPPPPPLEGGKGIYVAGEATYAESPLVILNLPEVFRQALETGRV